MLEELTGKAYKNEIIKECVKFNKNIYMFDDYADMYNN